MNCGLIMIYIGLFLTKWTVMPITKFINLFKRRKTTPPIRNKLLLNSAKKLAFMIRTRKVTCELVIRTYIQRVEEVNKVINAVVQNRFEHAINEAKEVDKYLQYTYKTVEEIEIETPLLGVPLTVKESLCVIGMSNNAGSLYKNNNIATEDSEIVDLAKKAGAIPLLVSNTPELCVYWETYNKITGRTLNPYDTRRTVGGSSGGEAALLASGASVLGLGSDICGSLRLPPMFNGVYGHKPSARAVSIRGHVPDCYDILWPKYFALGPMTRYAEDMPLFLSVIAKPELKDVLKLNEPVSIKDIKFYYMENKTNSETINAIQKFATYLNTKYKIPVKKINIKLLKNAFEVIIPQLLKLDDIECPFYNPETKEFKIGAEFMKFITCRSDLTLPAIFFGIIKKMGSKIVSEDAMKLSDELTEKLLNHLQRLLGDDGVLLYPTFSGVAHFHNEILYKVLETSYMSTFNVLGLPATSCPTGYTADGLPFGIQIIANHNNDRLTIAVAQELEKVFGGWIPPNNESLKVNVV